MKIAFIKVNMMYSKGKDALKPLVFSLIEELTPAYHELVFYDERIETLPDTLDADVIALSVETFAAKRAYELAEKYKKKDNLIVMGGYSDGRRSLRACGRGAEGRRGGYLGAADGGPG